LGDAAHDIARLFRRDAGREARDRRERIAAAAGAVRRQEGRRPQLSSDG
jgi:hypothetical protein